jgi:5'-nucleotidase
VATSGSVNPPVILITNDDGIRSPGLVAAAEAVVDLGELLLVGPATQQTSMSRAFVSGPDIGIIERVNVMVGGRTLDGYAVTGSPVLAVAHGLLELTERQPALCISGINYGENIGAGLGVSGTIGAAMEAAAYGVPSLAVSIAVEVSEWRSFPEVDWSGAKYFTRKLAQQLLAEGLPEGVSCINLNVPRQATAQTELRRTVQSRQRYYVHRQPDRRRPLGKPFALKIEIVVDADGLEPDGDIQAVVYDRAVSVTPLTWSMTARTDWQPAG